jgi:hypothetical protein
VLAAAGIEHLFEVRIDGVVADEAVLLGWVVGVDHVGQAEALRSHGANMVVADLSQLLEER